MSLNFLNVHAKEGEPLGDDVTPMDIAEYYTDAYLVLADYLNKVASVPCAPAIIHEYTAEAKAKLKSLQ